MGSQYRGFAASQWTKKKCAEAQIGKSATEEGVMAASVRVGIVGAGFAARFHLKGLQRVFGVNVEVAGVSARSKQSAEKFASEANIKPFAGFEELCAACDVVDLCSPPSTHEALAIAALRRG